MVQYNKKKRPAVHARALVRPPPVSTAARNSSQRRAFLPPRARQSECELLEQAAMAEKLKKLERNSGVPKLSLVEFYPTMDSSNIGVLFTTALLQFQLFAV